MALDLLAQAPGEFELRQITCGMKIARELERVGDEATTIARRAILLMTLPPLVTPLDIAEMTFLANAMHQGCARRFRLRQHRARPGRIVSRDWNWGRTTT